MHVMFILMHRARATSKPRWHLAVKAIFLIALSLVEMFLAPSPSAFICVSGWLAGCRALLATLRALLPQPAGTLLSPSKTVRADHMLSPRSERCHSASAGHILTH